MSNCFCPVSLINDRQTPLPRPMSGVNCSPINFEQKKKIKTFLLLFTFSTLSVFYWIDLKNVI